MSEIHPKTEARGEEIENADRQTMTEHLDHDALDHKAVQEALDDDPVYTFAEQRKIIHRVDRRLISVAGVIYMNSLMDRSNLPNANIAGMDVDLGMNQGFRYVSSLHLDT